MDDERNIYIQHKHKESIGCEGDCGICSSYEDGICTFYIEENEDFKNG